MKVVFDKNLYYETAVRRAIDDYSELAEIKMTSTPDSCVCSIIRSDYPLETTTLEFSNYVLNLSVMSEKNA